MGNRKRDELGTDVWEECFTSAVLEAAAEAFRARGGDLIVFADEAPFAVAPLEGEAAVLAGAFRALGQASVDVAIEIERSLRAAHDVGRVTPAGPAALAPALAAWRRYFELHETTGHAAADALDRLVSPLRAATPAGHA